MGLEKFLDDLESGRAYEGMRKNSGAKHTDMKYCARYMSAFLAGKKKVVELGTGRGQGFVLFCNAINEGTVTTVDIRKKNKDIVDAVSARYPGNVAGKQEFGDSVDDKIIQRVMADGKPIDVLFIDSLHTRERVLLEVRAWFPHLAEDAVVFFHDALWCFDTVYEVVNYIIEDTDYSRHVKPHAKFEDFVIDDWPGLGKVGIDSHTMRPYVQSKDEIVDTIPDADELTVDLSERDGSGLRYELMIEWPGLITITNASKELWGKMAERADGALKP